MITELTNEQRAEMFRVRNKWLDAYFALDQNLDADDIRPHVEFLYELCDFESPYIFVADSPLEAQIYANVIDNVLPVDTRHMDSEMESKVVWKVGKEVRSKLRSEIRPEVRSKVISKVGKEVRSKIGNEVESKVMPKVRSKVGNEVSSKIGNEVELKVWDKVSLKVGDEVVDLKVYRYGLYGAMVSCNYWVAHYDFLLSLIDVDEDLMNKFNSYKALIEKPIFGSIQLKEAYIAVKMPLCDRRDADWRLHCVDGPAMEWSDGFRIYALNGIVLSEDIYKKWYNNELSFDDVMQIKETDQRTILLKHMGVGRMKEEAGLIPVVNAKESKLDIQMYIYPKAKNGLNEDVYMLNYKCPSTNKEYLKAIPPELGQTNDPDLCMAKMHNCDTKEEYYGCSLHG